MREDNLKEIINRCDLAIVDLDQCIYPQFTQTRLGAIIFFRVLQAQLKKYWSPGSAELARCFPRLAQGAGYIIFNRFVQLFGCRAANYDLMNTFSRVVNGLPMAELERVAGLLPQKGLQNWKPALAALSRRMPVYLLTFSIEPIAREYGLIQVAGKKIFSGWQGTPLEVSREKVIGVKMHAGDFKPGAKLKTMQQLLKTQQAQHPLIIGHGYDESAMATWAQKHEGGSIALRRVGSDRSSFELTLGLGAWRKIQLACFQLDKSTSGSL